MKVLIVFLGMILSAGVANAACEVVKEENGQRLFSCQAPGTEKAVSVLDLHGDFARTAYYHGYFLKEEIESGVLKGVMDRTEKAFASLSAKERRQIQTIQTCVLDNYKNSVSEEFKTGLRNLHRGLRDAGSRLAWRDFENANYMVEFSIYTDSMQRKMTEDPRKMKKEIFGDCAPYFIGQALTAPFRKLAQGLRSIKLGCTGMVASARGSAESALVHGRNFDTGLLGYYEKNQVVVINRQKNGLVSVGIASAGLHYAGGISGFNNQGLSVSLHELQTEATEIRHRFGSSDIAPYLLHSVLMKARTLDEAIAILQARKGFGAWTFFISDAKSDESASIELSGDIVRVARREKNKVMAQTNHFLSPDTAREGYEYSLNKTLETRARYAHVLRRMQEDFGRITPQWVINHLSGHHDELVGRRSFGRTTTKVYTAGTHVMIPARQEWWMSLGDTYPTHRSHFVGFRLTNNLATPVEIVGVTRAAEEAGLPNWYASMNYYVQAYLNHERNPVTLSGIDQTLQLLEKAQFLAHLDGVYEVPYHFMWARLKTARAALAISQGQRELAILDLEDAQKKYLELAEQPSLHPYERFQVAMWQFRNETLKPAHHMNRAFQAEQRSQAEGLLAGLIQLYSKQRELRDLKASLQEVRQLPIVQEADVRFGTVE